ncbi:MAG: porin [Pseudomonadota bacterium]
MHSRLFVIFACLASTTSAFASSPEVKLRAGIDFQAGYYSDNAKGPLSTKNVSADKKYTAFNSTAYVAADAKNTLDSGFVYGAQINLATTAKNTRKLASFIYTESNAGRWELGSNKSAYATMKVHGYSNACATAGGWDVWVRSDPANRGGVYITNFGNFLDPKTRNSSEVEYSRKITYYTPELKNFQLGVSYIPDTTNIGSKSFSDADRHDPTRSRVYNIDIRDGIALGLTHKHEFTNDFKIRSAIVGEMGKPVQAVKPTQAQIAWKKLRTYTIGTEVTYKDFSIAGSYMDYMKSITSSVIDTLGRDSRVYGATARYNHTEKLSYSLSYFSSKHKASSMNTTTLATQYKLAPGILPYAEVSLYKTSGRHIKNNQLIQDGYKGALVLFGAKLEL